MSKTVKVMQTTREIVKSFKRNDVKVRRKLASKYWKRATNRTDQILHAATNFMVKMAADNGAAFALEDLTDIKKMYSRENRHSSDYRFRLNSWPYRKASKMLEYKSEWEGVPTISLTKAETRGSSMVHWACGEKLYNPEKGEAVHRRMLWCQSCKIWVDRDANAAVVLSHRGLARFASSLSRPGSLLQQVSSGAGEQGRAGEALKGNGTGTLILRVDASKLGGGHDPTLYNGKRGPSP